MSVQPARDVEPPYDLDTEEGMKAAIRWQLNMLASINDGGAWVVPRSLSIYKIDHKNMIATKMAGDPEPSIERVFNQIGWKVVNGERSAQPAGKPH